MSVQTDPLPPVPEHTPPVQEDAAAPVPGKYFNHIWTRWLTSLREKVNVISESLVNLGDVGGDGVVTKQGESWGTQPVIRLLPAGGTSSQVLAKTSGNDYEVGWVNQSGGGGTSAGNISFTIGSRDGTPLTVGASASGVLPTNFDLSGNWFLWCYPAGSLEVDIWIDDFLNIPPTAADSIVNGNYPSISAGISASGDFTGWSDALTATQAITLYIRSVSGGVAWATLTMQGVKS